MVTITTGMGMRMDGSAEVALPEIILASRSPRRSELLRQIGVRFRIMPADIDESTRPEENPRSFVERLAREKAEAIARDHPNDLVLGSDTIVLLDGEILGKPEDSREAVSMLRRLSGAEHTVLTGYALLRLADQTSVTGVGEARVTFRELEDDEISRYVAGGSPMDKAGSYGIQEDLGAVFIEDISGDYYTIVGLPLAKVYLALRRVASSGKDGTPHSDKAD